VWLDVFLTNIDQSHPGAKELLKKGGIAVARSLIPGALSAVDKTMEETFMKFAKSLEVEIDVLRAEAAGKEAKEAFIRDHFVNGSSEALFEPIKRQKRKTM
jgi:radical SAM superfamily enzyme YgiQ (UPF0313 family)